MFKFICKHDIFIIGIVCEICINAIEVSCVFAHWALLIWLYTVWWHVVISSMRWQDAHCIKGQTIVISKAMSVPLYTWNIFSRNFFFIWGPQGVCVCVRHCEAGRPLCATDKPFQISTICCCCGFIAVIFCCCWRVLLYQLLHFE